MIRDCALVALALALFCAGASLLIERPQSPFVAMAQSRP